VIFHGRRVCHARTPACGACTLATDCPSYGLGPTEFEAAVKLLKGPRAEELAQLARPAQPTRPARGAQPAQPARRARPVQPAQPSGQAPR